MLWVVYFLCRIPQWLEW